MVYLKIDIGLCLFYQGKRQKVLEHFDKIVTAYPDKYCVHSHQSFMRAYFGKFKETFESCKKYVAVMIKNNQ